MKPSHPAAELLPMVTGAAFDELVADIREHGLRNPIIRHPDGSILDGRSRALACEAAGRDPRYQEWAGELGTEGAFITEANRTSRDLSPSQAGMLAARLALYHPMPLLAAAELAGASSATATRAMRVLMRGPPELVAEVERGERTVKSAVSALEAAGRGAKPAPEPVAPPVEAKPPQLAAPSAEADEARRKPGRPPRARLTPPGGKTVEQVMRESMEHDGPQRELLKLAGMNHHTYRRVRLMVMLADYPALTPEDRARARGALDYMNEHRVVIPAFQMVEPLIDRIWGPQEFRDGKPPDRAEAERKRRFLNTVGLAVQYAAFLGSVEVPYVTPEDAKEWAADIDKAAAELAATKTRILEEAAR